MKKILLSAGLITTILTANAQADPYRGFYGGAQLGWGQLKLKDKGSPLIKGTQFDLRSRGTVNSIPFGFHLGIAACGMGKIYVAGEFGMDAFVKRNAKVFSPYLDGKLGYRVQERIVIYGSVGATWGIFKLKQKNKKDKSSNEFGFRPGAGAMFAINDKMIAGLQYNYTRYSNVTYHETIAGNRVQAKFRPEMHTVMARLSFVFG